MKAMPNRNPLTGNVLINFPAIDYVNGVAPSTNGPAAWMVRVTEVTHDAVPEIVFDLAISEYANYQLILQGHVQLSRPSDPRSVWAPANAGG